MEECYWGKIDTVELIVEGDRLERTISSESDPECCKDPLEGLLDDDRTQEEESSFLREEWDSLDTPIYLIHPVYPGAGTELREWSKEWWIGHKDDQYWLVDAEDDWPGVILKEASDRDEAIWRQLDTEVYAVVRDRYGVRRDEKPELVRFWRGEEWLSLWAGVCEARPTARIDDLELVPVVDWESPRREVPHTQVRDRIAARLRERGITSKTTERAWGDPGRMASYQEVNSTLRTIWESLGTQQYLWVESCHIDQVNPERLVRLWQRDVWVMQAWRGQYRTISTEELEEWGCLVRLEDWERAQREGQSDTPPDGPKVPVDDSDAELERIMEQLEAFCRSEV
jgi:hypothetical protein